MFSKYPHSAKGALIFIRRKRLCQRVATTSPASADGKLDHGGDRKSKGAGRTLILAETGERTTRHSDQKSASHRATPILTLADLGFRSRASRWNCHNQQ
jgi:hypothetical protein